MDRQLGATASRQIGAWVAACAALAVGGSALLWLVNLEGPFGEHGRTGAMAALGCAAATGAALYPATTWLARRSLLAVLGWIVALLCSAIVLVPHRIDVSESFVPRPNDRSSCSGLTFEHYPPGTMDGSTITYCIGLEHPLPVG